MLSKKADEIVMKIIIVFFLQTMYYVLKGLINMKYTYRKFVMMHSMYKNVKDDKYRKHEALQAFKYVLCHPSFLFLQKTVEAGRNSVLKNVNVLVNYPYYDSMYKGVRNLNR